MLKFFYESDKKAQALLSVKPPNEIANHKIFSQAVTASKLKCLSKYA